MTAFALAALSSCLALLLMNARTLKLWRRTIELNQRILDQNHRLIEERAEALRAAYQAGLCAGVGIEMAREAATERVCSCDKCRRERLRVN